MIRIGDYRGEMSTPDQVDDATAEALLAGRVVGDELGPLVWAVHALRGAAQRPTPPPRGELATLMAAGVLGSAVTRHRPAARGAAHRGLVAATTRKWRRMRMAAISALATVAAKLAGLSTAAKATAGLTIALASVGTAGATGVLPDPAQDRFDTVVESVTGDRAPGDLAPDRVPEPANENAEFGERVSEDAKDGGVDGEQISEEARQLGEQRRPELPDPIPGAGKPSQLPTPRDPPISIPSPPAPPHP